MKMKTTVELKREVVLVMLDLVHQYERILRAHLPLITKEDAKRLVLIAHLSLQKHRSLLIAVGESTNV